MFYPLHQIGSSQANMLLSLRATVGAQVKAQYELASIYQQTACLLPCFCGTQPFANVAMLLHQQF